MSWWERVKQVLSSEASDVKEEVSKIGRALDEELARKEAELDATPSERLDMILGDIEESDTRLDELTDEIEGTPSPPEKRPTTGSISVLDAADFSDVPRFAAVAEAVTVEPTQDSDPLVGQFGHCAWIDDQVGDVISDPRLASVAADIAEHPLVEAALFEDREAIYVNAPTLHHDDVRWLVTKALAERMPEDWDGTTPD